jgi:hypothetical protein
MRRLEREKENIEDAPLPPTTPTLTCSPASSLFKNC